MTRALGVALLAALLVAATGCGGEDDAAGADDDGTLVVYSGREEEIVEPLFERFEEQTGIEVEARYGDSAELAATIAEEGDNSPADVFFAQDAGTLGAVAAEGLLAQLPQELLGRVDARFRDPDGRWVGTSGRARVVVYNTEALSEDELPDTIFGYTDPRWKGKLGLAPTNASFQAFVSAMRLTEGEERTREWLEGIKANEPKFYEKNTPVVEAVANGEIDAGFVNHYYLSLVQAESPDAPVANHFLQAGDPGALVNVAGAAVVAGAEHAEAAQRFVEFLLSEEGQRFYAEEAAEAEYPLAEGVEPREGLPPLESLQDQDVSLGDLGAELESTLELLNELGYTS
ncbi:MAG TPA: iron ABC transporter substrate-binding protein [Gaiellaceae bacterium]|nr:iron ABC transporter substrate-binding protein [Gaiellaceae bacterium]